MLQKFNSGLIVLSGCNKGEMPSLIEKGETEKARKSVNFYRDVFGDDFLFGQFHDATKGAFVIFEEAIASFSPWGS